MPVDLQIASKRQGRSVMLFVAVWNVRGGVGFLYVEEKQLY